MPKARATPIALALLFAWWWPTVPLAADPPILIVATIPVLKDLAEQVGGSRVVVTSLLSGLESEHTYSPKPGDIVAIRKARVFLQIGVGLEVWATPMVKNSGNKNLLVVTTSSGIGLLRDPSAAMAPPGDDHHEGNPHIWLDPENAKVMIRHITEALIRVDPVHADEYRDHQAAYLKRLDAAQRELDDRVRKLENRRLLVHHPAWPYFARRFGFEIVGTIVNQAGAEPSAQHLQELIAVARKRQVRVIVSEPQLNPKVPQMLARETGARVVILSALPGGVPGTDSYLDLLRYNVTQLANALS